MSIPGLGQIPTQPTASTTRVVTLRPACEWRFQTSQASPVIVKLLAGTAEKDGVELGPKNAYTFAGIKSKILTWHGCELEIDGRCDAESVAEYANPTDNPANTYMNLHGQLNDMRQTAAREGKEGPRVLIVGPADVGKSTVARTLTSYATRQGYQPLVVNANPREGLLSLPGTLSASVLATVLDPEAVDGWGSTPTSGPSSVPVKLPLVFYYGRASPDEDPDFYRELTSKLAGSVSARLSEDEDVKKSGVIIDGMGLHEQSKDGFELVAHIVDEFSVNVIIVIGSTNISSELSRRFSTERTSLGEPISVVPIDKSDGVVIRDEAFLQHVREAAIKEYFFGDSKRTLSPLIQQVDFDNVIVYHNSDGHSPNGQGVTREDPSSPMQHWTFAIMHATPKESSDSVRAASVMGFLYVSDVDEERRKIKLLAPVSGRLGDQPLVWGKWPEPFINLLG
ncbi:related to cleavage/polyadenylation factor IA subunit [Fusarium torulosum]|uniref:Polynucleotide 5'-hydroxyl-kinase GRC3 n=1 Tax=Fusarium torulosum TaxID=33205 RepID=A0AAE8M5D1_9HYPO|nr:related to cleavage/polyadenylation factor IA subunit [Fusarium torulosum]